MNLGALLVVIGIVLFLVGYGLAGVVLVIAGLLALALNAR